MRRTTLAAILVLTACLAPATARAGDDEGPLKVTQIHDATDLVERVPGLTEALRSFVPDALLHESQPGVYVLKATGAVQNDFARILEGLRRDLAGGTMEADAVLDRAHANAKTLAQLRTSEVTLDAEELSVQTLLTMVVQAIEINAIVSPGANGRMAKATASVRFRDAPGSRCLDAIAKLGKVAWCLDGGIVRIVTPEERDPGRFRVDVTTGGDDDFWKTIDEPWGRPKDYSSPKDYDSGEPGLLEMVRALRAEVRALREEVREVKQILEEMRAR